MPYYLQNLFREIFSLIQLHVLIFSKHIYCGKMDWNSNSKREHFDFRGNYTYTIYVLSKNLKLNFQTHRVHYTQGRCQLYYYPQ